MPAIEFERLRLRHAALSRRDFRRPKPLAAERRRIVEIDERRLVVELDRGEREREAAAPQDCRRQALPAKRGELFDDTRHRAIGEIQAAVLIWIVVAPFALIHLRKPERAVDRVGACAAVPGEAAMQDHAKESARSARMARISSSARPDLTRSIGRRSPSRGLMPNSQATAASRA